MDTAKGGEPAGACGTAPAATRAAAARMTVPIAAARRRERFSWMDLWMDIGSSGAHSHRWGQILYFNILGPVQMTVGVRSCISTFGANGNVEIQDLTPTDPA